MRFNLDLILKEIDKRDAFKAAIDKVISDNFEYSEKPLDRVKRGLVHSFVAGKLGLKLNNKVCLTIRERIESKGIKKYISRGDLYYKHIKLKKESEVGM